MKKRKGFTLVELLVVIAILAILATVSIIGYTSFIKKANESNALTELTQVKELFIAQDITDDYLKIGNDGLVISNKAEVPATYNDPIESATAPSDWKTDYAKYYEKSGDNYVTVAGVAGIIKCGDGEIAVADTTYYEDEEGNTVATVEAGTTDVSNYYKNGTVAPEWTSGKYFTLKTAEEPAKGYTTLAELITAMNADLGSEVAGRIYVLDGNKSDKTFTMIYYLYDDVVAEWDTKTGDVQVSAQLKDNIVAAK